MVWKFEVTWSMCSKPKRLLAAARRWRARRTRETARGSRARSTKRKVVSPNGVVIENMASVPPSSVKRWMSVIERAAALLEQRERALDVLDLEDQRADALGVLAQVAPGAAAFADRLVDDEQRVAGLERGRALASLLLQLGAAAPDLGEVELVDEEAPRPLEVVHVVVERFDALDADRPRRHDLNISAELTAGKGENRPIGVAPCGRTASEKWRGTPVDTTMPHEESHRSLCRLFGPRARRGGALGFGPRARRGQGGAGRGRAARRWGCRGHAAAARCCLGDRAHQRDRGDAAPGRSQHRRRPGDRAQQGERVEADPDHPEPLLRRQQRADGRLREQHQRGDLPGRVGAGRPRAVPQRLEQRLRARLQQLQPRRAVLVHARRAGWTSPLTAASTSCSTRSS